MALPRGMITGSQSAADRIAVNFQAIAVAAQLFVQITKPLALAGLQGVINLKAV